MQDLHDAEFKKTDCLKCANCCKTTDLYSPLQILSGCQNILKPQQFIEQYLVLMKIKTTYCKVCLVIFWINACMIYEVRPKACREFHTLIEKEISTNFRPFEEYPNLPCFNIVEEMKKNCHYN
jgi:Fe-S-cluster containining protein